MLARKALAGTAGTPKLYVEDVFSTYLYTGTGSTQTITNNIDLSGKGGLVWLKNRSVSSSHRLVDTVRGALSSLFAESTSAASTRTSPSTDVDSFSSTGFVAGNFGSTNGDNWCSWTFRKAKKFFDVVTYTGTGSLQTVSHNLGSVPGCIIIKNLSDTDGWLVYHRSIGATKSLTLNSTGAAATDGNTYFNDTEPTSTVFTVKEGGKANQSGNNYVAYLFAHDAGGFGDAGSDNVISCGSFTGNGSGDATVTLGYEPQWLLYKKTNAAGSWYIADNMRNGLLATGASSYKALYPNNSNAEAGSYTIVPTATGFQMVGGDPDTFIYIAIRRGPMKTPTSGTSVFSPLAYTGDGTSGRYISGSGFPPDLIIQTARSSSENREFDDRLRGGGSTAMNALLSNSTNAEATDSGSVQLLNQDGFTVRSFGNGSSVTYIGECFRRAPGFFDVVCYTGTGSARTVSHNLGVVPELMIVKNRSNAWDWAVYDSTNGNTKAMFLNKTDASSTLDYWNNTSPTSSVFTVNNNNRVNVSGNTYVAYLFASLSGVSKVGSYTGNGSSVTVTTDFQPRFILVKRTDSTGNWIVSDSARGLVSGSDPYLLLNSTAAEDTDEDWVDVSSTGFTVNETSAANANVNTGTYIYLAIA